MGEVRSDLSSQVFVDDSGRRRRWVRVAGSAMTVLCAGYIGIVAVGLSQTAVGPLIDVPAGGNGEIAGLQSAGETVPGLLVSGGVKASPARPSRSQTGGSARAVPRAVTPKAAKVEPKATTVRTPKAAAPKAAARKAGA